MADLNAINLEITGTSESAQEAVKSTAAALEGLKALTAGLSGIKFSEDTAKSITAISNAMSGIANAASAIQGAGSGGFAGLSGFAAAVHQLADACKSLTQDDIAKLQTVANAMNAAAASKGVGNLADNVLGVSKGATKRGATGDGDVTLAEVGQNYANAGKGVWNFAKKNVQTLGKLGKAFKSSKMFSSDFVRSLARIAKYRILRTILSSITKGATEGMKNLARASSDARATLTQLSSASLTLKNSAGGALYSALASVVGVLSSIINAAVSAMNWINMLFSILGGRGTFMKATSATKEYGDALGGAAGGAKALKQELMGFDEINSLSPDSGGGGGGGGGASLDYDSMFEETPVDQSLVEMVEKADFTLLGERVAKKVNDALSNVDWAKVEGGGKKLGMSIATFINGAVFNLDPEIVGRAIAGVVTSALNFVNTFVYTVDWNGLGQSIWNFISNAIKDIKPTDIGMFLAGKIKMATGLLAGLLDNSREEWAGVTKWITDAIRAAVDSISREDIAAMIRGAIIGGFRLLTDLADSRAFSRLADTLLGAITDGLSAITGEQMHKAINAGIKESWRVGVQMMEFVIDITMITVRIDSPIVDIFSTFALYKLLKASLTMFGIKGYTAGKIFSIAGLVYSSIDLIVSITDAISSVKEGEGISAAQIVEIVGNAFKVAGFALLTRGNVKAGAIVLAIGVIIEPVVTIAQSVWGGSAASNNASTLQAQIDSFDKWNAYQQAFNMAQMEGGIYSDSWIGASKTDVAWIVEYYKALDKYGNVAREVKQSTRSGFTDSGVDYQASIRAFEDAAKDYEGIAKYYSYASDEYKASVSEFDFFMQRVVAGAKKLGVTEEEILAIANSIEGFSDTASSVEVPEIPEIEGVPEGVYEGYNDVSGAATDAAEAMKATGEHAEELYTKIVEIPSDIVYNLELNNYDKVMEDLDGLQEAITSAGNDGAAGLKSAFDGLGDWFVTNVADPITGALDISLMTYGRKMMNTFKNGLKSVSLPKFKIEWTNNTEYATIMGQQHALTIPTPTIKFYAKGGFPSAGELFLANEAGPEMIGRIGNRTAVANQEQIGDAIFKYMDQHGGGKAMDPNVLAGAIVGALKSAGVGAVYLDGKMLANSINREARRSGKPAINY